MSHSGDPGVVAAGLVSTHRTPSDRRSESQMFRTPRLFSLVTAWPAESHQQARRNAMIASTALAQRRAEREDVEEFFAALGKDATAGPVQPVVAPTARVAHG